LTTPVPPRVGTRFSLSYLKQLGVNALWRKPIHPRDRRAPDRSGHQSAVRARQPVCGQGLLRRDAVDGLGFYSGLLARRERHAAGARCGAPDNISAGCPDADAVREWTEPWDRVGTAPLNGDANKHMVDGVVPAYDASDFDPGPSLAGPRSCASCGSRPGSNTVSSARRWLPTANCWSRLSTVRSTSMN
jgi:hypothetical protein